MDERKSKAPAQSRSKIKSEAESAEAKSAIDQSVEFRASLFRRDDLPKKLSTESGRTEEGVWGMQELKVDDEDFVMVFGRTWGGSVGKQETNEVFDPEGERLKAPLRGKKK